MTLHQSTELKARINQTGLSLCSNRLSEVDYHIAETQLVLNALQQHKKLFLELEKSIEKAVEDTNNTLKFIKNSDFEEEIKQSLIKEFKTLLMATFDRSESKHDSKAKGFQKGSVNKQPGLGFVYLVKGQGCYKIGKSKNPWRRIEELRMQSPYKITLVHIFCCLNMATEEKMLHKRYQKKLIRGEWFNLSSEDVSQICQIEIE